jgi:hypothetical protein
MTKETRYNLIFLVIVIVVLLPGAIFLFRKKMDPNARRADLPDAVPRTVAFMDPQPLPPGMRRVAPPKTVQWLHELARERAGADASSNLVDSDGLPLMSDDKTFQVVAIKQDRETTHIWLACWDPVDEEFFRSAEWSLALHDRALPAKSGAVESIPIPNPVRDELGENGLLKPPKTLAWRELIFPRQSAETWRLSGRSSAKTDHLVFVPSFTNPVASEK